ncbi:MAG: DUF5060 domain-containing protein [Opitutaceae bacterium]|nr:DUF5060 domain-containing protein [Opitutaceae bacterium]
MKPLLLLVLLPSLALAAPRFEQSAQRVDCYDFVEVTLTLDAPPAGNPFTDVKVTGEVTPPSGPPVKVTGFCDAADGTLFRWRFMPSKAGEHSFTVTCAQQNGLQTTHSGRFIAQPGKLAGPVRVDPEHPFHFIREGTGQHWFWNATTTYQLLAWDDDSIAQSVDRLAKLGVNRIRVALAGRIKDGKRWNEPLVMRTEKFAFKMEPWVAARPDNLEDPGFDVTRFNLELYRKAERLLRRCRERDIVVSLIFYVDGFDKGVDPFGKERMGGQEEQLYYLYTLARLAAFPNGMWDVANEYRKFRTDAWAEQMGALVKEHDPYHHLTSTHGHGDFRFRKSPWADYAMYQSWDEHGGYQFMLKNRREQAAAGRPMPQVNEEYGYEDHYPFPWGEKRLWPARIADNRRQLAWEMSMAGCYQTTGERANDGTGAGPDTGGGWVNGRGNEHMTMLLGYRRMMDFFTSFPWWTLEPRPDLAGEGALLLAEVSKRYVAYLPKPGNASFQLARGIYRVKWFNPRTGAWHELPEATQAKDDKWAAPKAPGAGDWALLLEAKR